MLARLAHWLRPAAPIEVLDFPPPYRAMVAINSDVEWTGWPLQEWLLERFAELGLECSFSYWFYARPQPTWRLFEADGRPGPQFDAAVALIRAGVLDTIHGYGGRLHAGGSDFDRAAIVRGYATLEAAGGRTTVFSNHGSDQDFQNVGGDWASYQQGDLPGSRWYHLDRALAHGVRYFWTDIDYDVDSPWCRAAVDTTDGLLRAQVSRDGHRILRFRRFLGRLPQGPCATNLDLQLQPLLAPGAAGYAIVYQHLGVHRHPEGTPCSAVAPVFPPTVEASLEALAAAQRAGRMLVTTTARLLDHARLMAARPWRFERTRDRLVVRFPREFELAGIPCTLAPAELAGWTVEVPAGLDVACELDGTPIAVQRTATGARVRWSVPWPALDLHAALARARAALSPEATP